MLTLKRNLLRDGEARERCEIRLLVNGTEIVITAIEMHGRAIRLGFEAPAHVEIVRGDAKKTPNGAAVA